MHKNCIQSTALGVLRRARKSVGGSFARAGTSLATIAAILNLNAAAPPAGTSIGNQASATYTDSSGVQRTATSNMATTIVQQVASLTLSSDNTKIVSPGGQVAFPHTIVNTGNGSDTFNLTFVQLGGDDFDLSTVHIYADANGDGIPDNTTDIAVTPSMAAGSSFKFVVVGTAAGSQTDGQTSKLQVNVASVFSGTVTASNIDTAKVSANAVIGVTKAISAPSGDSPSGPYTVTLSYVNSGNSIATSLNLMDLLPSGMIYVPGSARWSGSALPLTDAVGGDPSGILFDYGITVAGRVTATIASVTPGQSGTLTFQVNIDQNLSPQVINNTATFSYDPGTGTSVGPFNSNTGQFLVNQTYNLTATGQTVPSVTQGATVLFTNTVVNTGNGVDAFEVILGANTFPPGTTFAIYQSDGFTPLLDYDNDGLVATPPVPAGGSYSVIVKAVLPASASGGGPYTLQKVLRSNVDSTKSVTVTDTLNTISSSTVDLTNDSAGPGAPGAGQGPEASAVKNVPADPGTTARFTLYVNNTSSSADSFNLSSSTDQTFASTVMPAGWTVVFHDAAGPVVTTTGVLPPGGSKLVYADVTIVNNAAPSVVDLYFRVVSPTTGATDIKHDAVTVNRIRALKLEPNNAGQVSVGGSVVYSHLIKNEGNVIEGDSVAGTVTMLSADNTAGFTSVIYWDQNNNGVLDPTDPVIHDLSQLVGGINGASTAAGLDVGEQARIFVKVFSPLGAVAGTVDSTHLTATTTGGVGTPPQAVSVTDVTTVISGDVILKKEQALAPNCDATISGAFSTANITTGAVPGACIRYRITVSNNGSAPALNVVVNDSTPPYTIFNSGAPATISVGSIVTTPANGSTGTLQFNIGTLNPGQSSVIEFGVKISQ